MKRARHSVGVGLAALLMALPTAISGCGTAAERGGSPAPSDSTSFSTPTGGKAVQYAYVTPRAGSDLEKVVATGRDDAWAIGSAPDSALLLRFDGRRWREAELPRRVRQMRLSAISASGADNVWLLGETSSGQAYPIRWDGSRWRPAPIDSEVHGMDLAALGADDVWLLGGQSTWHWDGSRWREHALPAQAAAISATSSDNVWAVGHRMTPESERRGKEINQPAAMRWDGGAWRLTPTPTYHFPDPVPPEPSAGLNHVLAVSPTEVWAVGSHSYNHGEVENEPPVGQIFLRWDGRRWSEAAASGETYPSGQLEPDGVGGLVIVSGSAVWRRGPAGSCSRLPRPPRFTGLPGTTRLYLSDVAHIPGTTSLWGVGTVNHNEAGNPWARGGIVRYR